MGLFKVVLTLTLVCSAYGGGKTLSPQESRQFVDLFQRYCGGGKSSNNQDGNTFYYCKFADNGPVTLDVNHEAEVNSGETPKQVIFVSPPSYNYVHNVALRGSPGNPQQTDIYVLPPAANHNLKLQDTRSAVQAQKPSLFFLSDNNDGGATTGFASAGASSRPSPVAQFGSSGLGGLRPSAPPPNPSNPDVLGFNTFYGAPSRNSRNVNYNAPYSTLL